MSRANDYIKSFFANGERIDEEKVNIIIATMQYQLCELADRLDDLRNEMFKSLPKWIKKMLMKLTGGA